MTGHSLEPMVVATTRHTNKDFVRPCYMGTKVGSTLEIDCATSSQLNKNFTPHEVLFSLQDHVFSESLHRSPLDSDTKFHSYRRRRYKYFSERLSK